MPSLATALLLLLLVSIASPIVEIVKAEAVGYLTIKDYLGTIWTLEDVEKIINTTIQTTTGELKSLADFFYIVIDDDTNNPINLRDFIASPLDNSTAVIPLPVGDHIVDIYWFGFHQRQLVHIVENTTYVLNLNTAPVMPLPIAENPPPPEYEWDLAYHDEGLTIQRRDGNAWIRFNYNQTFITVAVWDDDINDFNYYSLDIDIDNYDWRFHIKDPSIKWYNRTYNEQVTFLWRTYTSPTTYVSEHIEWFRNKSILHVTYQVYISKYDLNPLLKEMAEITVFPVIKAIKDGFFDPVNKVITKLSDYISWLQGAMDNKVAVSTLGYTETIILIWQVFVTPTQIIITAHAYDVDENGNKNPRPITSQNAFIINDRLVFMKLLHGGIDITYIDTSTVSLYTGGFDVYHYVRFGNSRSVDTGSKTIYYPVSTTIYVDCLSNYVFSFWVDTKIWRYVKLGSEAIQIYFFIDMKFIVEVQPDYADNFENIIQTYGYNYVRNNNVFTITVYSDAKYHEKPDGAPYGVTEILKGFAEMHIKEFNHPANVTYYLDIRLYGDTNSGTEDSQQTKVYYFKTRIYIYPAMTPPRISLLSDGYQKVNGVFAIQVFKERWVDENGTYMLGYYILDNEPPPSYIIKDVYYDIATDKAYGVWTIISVDCYGQDIVHFEGVNYADSLYEYKFSINPTVRLFNNVTLALFSFERMAFLNIDPELIKYLLDVPFTGYGTPYLDFETVFIIVINTTDTYELYYYKRDTLEWIRVKPVYYNDTKTYNIVRYDDNVLIEVLEVNKKSQNIYKYVYNGNTYHGYLFNDNGTLKMITGEIIWPLTEQEIKQLIVMTNPNLIMDQWAQAWEDIARKLGLISEGLAAAANWFNANWIWLLLGFFGVMFMILLIFALASRPRITVAASRTR